MRDSRTSGRSAQSRGFQNVDLFHEALNFGLEILGLGDISLTKKKKKTKRTLRGFETFSGGEERCVSGIANRLW